MNPADYEAALKRVDDLDIEMANVAAKIAGRESLKALRTALAALRKERREVISAFKKQAFTTPNE